MQIYTLYLSTLSNLNPPTNKTNLAQVSWNVSFKDLMGDIYNKVKPSTKIRVRAKLISASVLNTTLNAPQTNYTGNVVINLPNYHSGRFYNSANGSFLGSIQPYNDPIQNTYSYFMLDTTMYNSVSDDIVLPFEVGTLTVSIYDHTETTLMTNIQEYQLWIYLEIDDELIETGDPLNNHPIGVKNYVQDKFTVSTAWR